MKKVINNFYSLNSYEKFLSIFCIGGILMTGYYWFFGFSIILSVIFAAVLLKFFFSLVQGLSFKDFDKKRHLMGNYLSYLSLFLQFGVLYLLVTRRTGQTLTSPWLIFGPKFFTLFFLSSFCTLASFWKSKSNFLKNISLTFSGLLFYSVAAIIFAHGFGFDPIIHQAGMKQIVADGMLLPKQPFYIGQYVIEITLYYLTRLPIDLIDQFFLPILSGLLLPASLLNFFEGKFRHLKSYLLFFLPLPFFIVTTPHNFALLLSLVVALLISKKNGSKVVPVLVSLFTVTIHPLIGLPLLIISLSKLLSHKKSTILLSTSGIITALIVPLALLAQSSLSSANISLGFSLEKIKGAALELISFPHYFLFENAPLYLKSFYFFEKGLFISLLLLGLAWLLKTRKQHLEQFVGVISLVISSAIVISCINFSGVISYEQNNYGFRLLQLAFIFLVPAIVEMLAKFATKLPKKYFLVGIVLVALQITASWYITYPTRDKVSHYTGFAVRDADIEAVNFVDSHAGGEDYIVLTNQTVSSAALKEFGFTKYYETESGPEFYYAIPTGGPLYGYFRKMVYEKPKREWMLEAMEYAGVKKAYFIHTNYWAPAAEIRDEARDEADEWWDIGGQNWIYYYEK